MNIVVRNKNSGKTVTVSTWKAALVALRFMPAGSGARRDDANDGEIYAVAKFRKLRVIGIKNDPITSLILINSAHDLYGYAQSMHDKLIESLLYS